MISSRILMILKWTMVVFFIFAFAFKIFSFIDPDLGWHLRAGEIVTQTGSAPQFDPWTYTMQGHQWIDHEWLLDALLWNFWSNGTWFYVEIFFLITGLIPLFFWIRQIKQPIELIWVSLGGYMLLDIIGVRPQVLSILLFYILWKIVSERFIDGKYHKIYYFLPLLFLLWANIHGGFAVGLAVLLFAFLFRLYKQISEGVISLRNFMMDGSIVLLSFLATLLTPYGINLWSEIVLSTATPIIRVISEWQSSFVIWNISYPIFIGILIGLIFSLWKKLNRLEIYLSCIFILASMSHARILPMLLVVAIPLLAKCTTIFTGLVRVHPEERKINKIIIVVVCACMGSILFVLIRDIRTIPPYHPPLQAVKVESMLDNYVPGNTFNDYGLGGAMILHDPKSLVFIDGRLPHWKNSDGYSALQNYLDVISISGEWKTTFARYNIHLVILGREHEDTINNLAISNQIKLFHPYIQKVFRMFLPSKNPILLRELIGAGWCRIYQDEEATILVSPDTEFC